MFSCSTDPSVGTAIAALAGSQTQVQDHREPDPFLNSMNDDSSKNEYLTYTTKANRRSFQYCIYLQRLICKRARVRHNPACKCQ